MIGVLSNLDCMFEDKDGNGGSFLADGVSRKGESSL